MREALQEEHDEHARALRETLEPGGEDAVDRANDRAERLTLLAEIHLEEVQLAEVDAALARIRDGTYGICEATGHPIAAARLNALPWTRWSQAAERRGS